MAEMYPKLTQETLEASTNVVLNHLTDSDYLKSAPYSSLMINKIKEMASNVEITLKKMAEQNKPEPKKPTKADEEKQERADIKAEEDSIAKQYKDLATELEAKSAEYQENYGILIRLEKTIRSMERMTTKGSSDTVKMSAMTKLIDLQQEQLDVLSKLNNIEKAQKIESLTRNFFQEIRKTDHLKKVADKYLETLNNLD